MPNLTVGAMVSKQHSLTAVTVEGDKADRRGPLTGGHAPHHGSRMNAIAAHKKATQEILLLQQSLDGVRQQLFAAEQAVTKATADKLALQSPIDNRRVSVGGNTEQEASLREIIAGKQATVQALREQLTRTTTDLAGLQGELKESFNGNGKSNPNEQYTAALHALQREIEGARRMSLEASNHLSQCTLAWEALRGIHSHLKFKQTNETSS